MWLVPTPRRSPGGLPHAAPAAGAEAAPRELGAARLALWQSVLSLGVPSEGGGRPTTRQLPAGTG